MSSDSPTPQANYAQRASFKTPSLRGPSVSPPRPSPGPIGPRTVYIIEAGANVKFQYSRIVVRYKKGGKPAKVPTSMIDRLVLGTDVELHHSAHALLLAADIPVTFLDKRGRVIGHLRGTFRHDPSPRVAQYNLYLNTPERQKQATWFVDQKLHHARLALQAHKSNHPDFEWAKVRNVIDTTRKALPYASGLNQLRGYEGHAARVYWQHFDERILNQEFTFSGRTRRPPKDPTNALLSYTYTFLSNEIASILEAHGLDPYLGFLHETKPGRPSLALDLLEPLRPALADRFVLQAINRRRFSPEDFSPPGFEGAVYLEPEAKKTFFSAIESWFKNCEDQPDGYFGSPRSVLENLVLDFKNHLLENHMPESQPEDEEEIPEDHDPRLSGLPLFPTRGTGHGE